MKRYTTGDIAKAVGVEPSTIRAYNSREQMPPPTGHVGSTPYWEPLKGKDADDTRKNIEAWIEDRTKVATP